MKDCPYFKYCGIIKKYGNSNSRVVKGFIALYCKNEKQNECKRLKYIIEHGTPPSDELMPNGQMMND